MSIKKSFYSPISEQPGGSCTTFFKETSHSLTPSVCLSLFSNVLHSLRSFGQRTFTLAQSWLGDRSFVVAGPRLWNNLPVELRQRDICLSEFRRLLKTFLFC